MQVELISTIPTTFNNTSAIAIHDNNLPCCIQLQKHYKREINMFIDEYNKNCERECYLYKDFTIDEYNDMIDEYQQLLYSSSGPMYEQYQRELNHILRDKARHERFEHNLKNKHNQLYLKYTKPIDFYIREIVENTRLCNFELLDNIFDDFVKMITRKCISACDYISVIKSTYNSTPSKKVSDIFELITEKLINVFTEFIKKLGPNEYYPYNYKLFQLLDGVYLDVNSHIMDIYGEICEDIDNYMSSFPVYSTANVDNDETLTEKERWIHKSTLIKQYIISQLTNLHRYIITSLSNNFNDILQKHLIEISNCNKLYFLVEELAAPCDDISESTNAGRNESIVEELDSPEAPTSQGSDDDNHSLMPLLDNSSVNTIDSFIDTIPKELVDIATLTEQYNNHFNTSITSRSLGMMLSKSNKLEKQITFNEGKRVINYKHK